MKNRNKILLALFTVLYLLFWVGCTASDTKSEVSPVPESSALIEETATSSEVSEEAPARYSLGIEAAEEFRAYITEGGGILLPDGRTVTKQGVILSNKTLLPENIHFELTGEEIGGLLTLSDGTEIHDPYYVPYLDTLRYFPPIYHIGQGNEQEKAVFVDGIYTLPDGSFLNWKGELMSPEGRISEVGYVHPDETVHYRKSEDDAYFVYGADSEKGVLVLSNGVRIVIPFYEASARGEIASSQSEPEEVSLFLSLDMDTPEEYRARITEDGGILLPDGRTVTKQGIFLPDGTFLEENSRFILTGEQMGGILTLSDGIRIGDPYYVPYLDALDTFTPIYYMNQGDDRDRAQSADTGGLLFPDGRFLRRKGDETELVLPDGTEQEAEFVLPDGTMASGIITNDYFSYERKRSQHGALILSDGTRIIDPIYGKRLEWL